MKWIYNGIKYKTKKIDWEEYIEEPHDFLVTDIMVYNTKWDRCYYIRRLVYDKRRIRANLCSIYNTDCKWVWSDTKYLEMVVEDK
jgi:hypothetical protein|nr:MAG TPA: hypothetical protein [Caudoviricetes sp.]